jgi:uncharacterized membrane protein
VFYALYLVGVLIFAVRPALAAGSARQAVVFGALYGFFCYMTYDLTNLATLRDWPWLVALVDISWGMLLSAAAAWGGYRAALLVAPTGVAPSPPGRGLG